MSMPVVQLSALSRRLARVEIEALKIQGFRALYDTAVEPGSFTVLAGANNAGKTTLADALDFLAEVHRFKIETALSRKGGFENVAFRRMRRTRRPVSLQISVAMDLGEVSALRIRARRGGRPRPEGQAVVTHEFSFKAASSAIAADFSVVGEELSIDFRADKDSPSERITTIERRGAEVSVRNAAEGEMPGYLLRDPDGRIAGQ
jgi:energy-coupling factor transporter ATP-binding protein EcfA2